MSEATSNPKLRPPDEPPARFRLVHFLYGITLLASSVITFGVAGVFLGIPILGTWTYIFASRSRLTAFVRLCVVIVICLLLWFLLPSVVCTSREAARRSACKSNLKQIGAALHSYHETHQSLPPAMITASDGRPMHSWRVLLLPFLDQGPLYEEYDFDEPWNGPSNRKLLSQMPKVYACPSGSARNGRDEATSYIAVVGPETAWSKLGGREFSEFKDGLSNTIVIVELKSSGIPWMEPRDLGFDDALPILASDDLETCRGHRWESFFQTSYDGSHILLTDGTVRFLQHGFDSEFWSALLTVDDGRTKFDWHAREPASFSRKKLKIGNCCRFGVFVLLVLFPLPWVWRTRVARP